MSQTLLETITILRWGWHSFATSTLGTLRRRASRGRQYRKEHVEPSTFRQLGQGGEDLVNRIFLYLNSALDAEGLPNSGKEQAQIVVNLSSRRDGRTRIPGSVLLADSDGRRDAVDQIDIRLFDAFQELASVGGERLDVPALAFGVDRIEGEGGLARS